MIYNANAKVLESHGVKNDSGDDGRNAKLVLSRVLRPLTDLHDHLARA